MRIVLAGPKASGKSSIAKLLADELGLQVVDTDAEIERLYAEDSAEQLTCREIYNRHGDLYFRGLEQRAVQGIADTDWLLISTGGGALMNSNLRRMLRQNSILVILTASADVLWSRMESIGLPQFYTGPEGKERFLQRLETMNDVLAPYADVIIDTTNLSIEETAKEALAAIEEEVAIRTGAPNTLGSTIRLTTFGESHGPAIGGVLDGVPPGVEIDESDIQKELDRRRPGQSGVSTPRKEPDKIRILSGVFKGKTTGAPIGFIIENTNQIPKHYDNIRDVFRPGHADIAFWKKYGIRDYRGGGRSSGRETSARVAGGAIAKKILAERGVNIIAYALEIAGIRAEDVDYDEIERNPVRCPDVEAAERMLQAILEAKEQKDSVGGIVQIEVHGVPVGLGDPVFNKLDALLGRAFFSIGAVKGVEFGAGFAAPRMRGSEHNDEMVDGEYLTNNAGGILGGISSGADIIARLAVKPTASISQAQAGIDINGNNRVIQIEGRHDPCIVPRIIPVVEAMAALVILDLWETQTRLRPDWNESE